MKQRILYSYPSRLAFLVVAGIAAVAIIQVQSLLKIPSRIRHAFR